MTLVKSFKILKAQLVTFKEMEIEQEIDMCAIS